ncbi:unnamed protein product [Somion occarium]|uniref:NAD(P)-binding protein n=2 Tax=Somion occarium TaxID=3059160 RepID=A0ABP1DG43_9APHY
MCFRAGPRNLIRQSQDWEGYIRSVWFMYLPPSSLSTLHCLAFFPNKMSHQLVWLITGTSSGLGRDLTLAALKRGDKVIATGRARSLSKLDDLKQYGADTLELDVTSSLETLQDIAKKAVAIHGRIDILVNNAGFVELGTLEDLTHLETYNQFNTNVFGPLNINRVFLPYMRERKSGTVVWLGSIVGWIIGLYAGTKHAVRGLSESLHQEISPLGLRSICFEPGYFRTDFLSEDNRGNDKTRIEDYREINERNSALFNAYNHNQPGDPKKAVEVMIDVIKGDGAARGKEFPTVVALGSDAYDVIKGACTTASDRLEAWKDLTVSTDFPKGN